MKILVTGSAGFVGRNLTAALQNIRDGKDMTHPEISLDEIFTYDVDSREAELDAACARADFVFHFAGVNRPLDPADFMRGNRDAAALLLDRLKVHKNTCPVVFASSVQASLVGRYDNEYGRSKRAGEELFLSYGAETGAEVLIYRFPNLFGKWCRPNYNSVVATFCHNIANGLPIRLDSADTELELLYIDDLVEEMLAALSGKPSRAADPGFCEVPVTHRVTLGEIAGLIRQFSEQPVNLVMPDMPEGSFAKKLFSTYLSYLPAEKTAFSLTPHSDARGSFTEIMRTAGAGQISVNISRPGVTKGMHWHQSKWELFVVVSGLARIRLVSLDGSDVRTFEVSGAEPRAVYMLPGFVHEITNLSDTEDLVTLMWANEGFDPAHPDTYRGEMA